MVLRIRCSIRNVVVVASLFIVGLLLVEQVGYLSPMHGEMKDIVQEAADIAQTFVQESADKPVETFVQQNKNSKNVKTIFLANRFSDERTTEATWTDHLMTRIINKQCPESRCEFTSNPAELSEADAVIVSIAAIMFGKTYDVIQLPTVNRSAISHPQSQIWILAQYEGWPHLYICSSPEVREDLNNGWMDGWFNWTMSFRQDSEVQLKYGTWKKRKRKIFNISKKKIDSNYPSWDEKESFNINKPLVVWIVSHCHTINKREMYVHKLRQYMRVDIYGKCGKKSCSVPRQPENINSSTSIQNEPCFEEINRKYAFIIAFENAFCRDYATEKVYNGLLQNLIPISLSGNVSSDLYPPHSVIYAGNFETPKKLSEYLYHLIRTPAAYKSYFDWRYQYQLETYYSIPSPCDLCSKLHDPNFNPDTREKYADISEWMVDQSGCKEKVDWGYKTTMSQIRDVVGINPPRDSMLEEWREKKRINN